MWDLVPWPGIKPGSPTFVIEVFIYSFIGSLKTIYFVYIYCVYYICVMYIYLLEIQTYDLKELVG